MTDDDIARADPTSPAEHAFNEALIQFVSTLSSVIGLLDLVGHAESLESARLDPIQQSVESVSREHREQLYHAMAELGTALDEVAAETGSSEADQESDGLRDKSRYIKIEHPEVSEALMDMILGYKRHFSADPVGSIVRNALLTTMVAVFETLVAGLITASYHAKPEALPSSGLEFSLDDLRALGSVRDAEALSIARQVDSTMQGGFRDWRKWFEQRNIPFAKLMLDERRTMEVVQRRHAIVHNGGRASTLYLQRLKEAGVGTDVLPQNGQVLETDDVYMRSAYEALLAFGCGLTVGTWDTMVNDGGMDIAGQLLMTVEMLAQDNLWGVVDKLAEVGTRLTSSSDAVKLNLRCYGWLARKELLGIGEIREEVEEWDVSALGADFRLQRAILLDDDSEVQKLVDAAITSGTVTRRKLRSRAIFTGVPADADGSLELLSEVHEDSDDVGAV